MTSPPASPSSPPARRAPSPAAAPARPAVDAARPALGRALAAAAGVVIAVLTLVPQPVEPKTFRPWCLVCGDLGGTDVVANVLLFAPLGFALALAGLRRGRAVALALGLSLVIEILQLAGVPGRTGTLSDLLTNAAGALLGYVVGATWPRWLTPTAAAARTLSGAALAGWLATQTFGAWLFQPPLGGPTAAPRPLGELEGPRTYGWYAGHVTDAALDGAALRHAGTGGVRVEAAIGSRTSAAATVDASDARPGLVPFVLVADRSGRERLILGQLRGDAVVAAGGRPLRLALRRPTARIPDGLRVGGAPPLGVARLPAPLRLEGGLRGDTVWVRARAADGATREGVLRLAPSLLWSALVPWVRPSTPLGELAQALWLAALLAPLGYWLAWTRRGGGVAAAIVAAAALGTWGIGAAFGYEARVLGDPLAAAAGGLAAWLVGAGVARRSRGDSPTPAPVGRAS